MMQTVDKKYIAMELAPLGDLLTLVAAEQGLAPHVASSYARAAGLDSATAAPVFARVAAAVQHIHQQGIAHRDLKPENILMFPHLHPKVPRRTRPPPSLAQICDFGLSKRFGPDGMLRTSCGSVAFCAPELFSGSPYHATKARRPWPQARLTVRRLTCGRWARCCTT